MNTKRFLYYTDLLCKKLDLHLDGFVKRIEAVRDRDWDRVEFIEKMMLEPIDKQILYLVDKIDDSGKE